MTVANSSITAQQYVGKMAAFQDLVLKGFECDLVRVVAFMQAPVSNNPYVSYSPIVPGLATCSTARWWSGVPRSEWANRHLHQTLIAKGGGAFKPGLHLLPPKKSVMNLWLTVLGGFGLPMDKFGEDSTGPLTQLLA